MRIGLGSAPLYQPDDEVLYHNEEGWIVEDINEDAVGGWQYELSHEDGRHVTDIYEGELE